MRNRDLYNYHLQIAGMNGNIAWHFFFSKIKEFYKQNGIRIETLTKNIDVLQKEFFVLENDKLKLEIKEGETDKTPVMIEGKTYEDYKIRFDVIMEMEVKIVL